MCFRRETDQIIDAVEGREPCSQRRVTESGAQRNMHIPRGENPSPVTLLSKQ